MRPELLEAYWDIIRDGIFYKKAADRHGVSPGQVWKVRKTSVISKAAGRPVAFVVFQDFLLLPDSIKKCQLYRLNKIRKPYI